MRKLFAGLIGAVLVWGAVAAQADTTNTYTNALGQVVTTVTDSMGTRTTSVVLPNTPPTSVRTEVIPLGCQISTNASLALHLLPSPRDIGDICVNIVSGVVWVATGVATSNWTQVSN